MPLPHFLVLITAVILASAASLWAALSVGVPLGVMALGALAAAGLAHLVRIAHQDGHRG